MSWQIEGFGLAGPCIISGGSRLEDLLDGFRPQQGRVFIIIEEKVGVLHGAKIPLRFHRRVFLPSLGDGLKQSVWLNKLLALFAGLGVRRDDWIMAIGGGGLLDLAGFAASIYLRGIRTVLVPSTLLAQVDAAIGGKCGMNWRGVKNLVGSLHFPDRVFCAQDILETLPLRHYYAGMAEVLKYHVLWQVSQRAAFKLLCRRELLDTIESCCRYKDELVARDPFDIGVRRILNFGHTLAHALEALDGAILHGEAVAWGMEYCLRIAAGRGYIDSGYFFEIHKILRKMPRKTLLPLEFSRVYDKMVWDKKNSSGTVRLILPVEGSFRPVSCSRKELEDHWNNLLR